MLPTGDPDKGKRLIEACLELIQTASSSAFRTWEPQV